MDKEFHYYVTYFAAQRAGFGADDAYRIAYASQYTDDNCVKYRINEGMDGEFENYVSQGTVVTEPQAGIRRIYPSFHFVPGRRDELFSPSARRRDGKFHLLNTIPNGAYSRAIMEEALATGDPFRIGIAAHAFTDCFAHQNFTGSDDSFNSLLPSGNALQQIIGHAEALNLPDRIAAVWHDRRLLTANARVDNRQRFLIAAAYLLKALSRGTAPRAEIERFHQDLMRAIGQRDDENRLAGERRTRYIQLIDGFRDYVESAWFDQAVAEMDEGRTVDFDDSRPPRPPFWIWRPGYKQSQWYAFQKALKEHQTFTLNLLKPLFAEMELVI